MVPSLNRRHSGIVGYYGINAAMENPESNAFKRLTHINLWFLNPDSSGNFSRIFHD
jgi:hypothetical protein